MFTPEQLAKIEKAETILQAGEAKCKDHPIPNGDTAQKRQTMEHVLTDVGLQEFRESLGAITEDYARINRAVL